MKLIEITTLPLLYDRTDKGYGVPVEGHEFEGAQELNNKLGMVRLTLDDIGWMPHIEAFLSAGTYVNKAGAHGEGIAIDFDGILLKQSPFANHDAMLVRIYRNGSDYYTSMDGRAVHIESLHDKAKTRFAALLSLYFGVVLTEGYNDAHKCHIHADLARPVKWYGSRSQRVLLKEISEAWNTPLRDPVYTDEWLDYLRIVVFKPWELMT